jgi:hypothetical protein
VELFLTGPMTGEAINDAGIAFKKALIEAPLNAELSHHLGYPPGSDKPARVSNHRNGSTNFLRFARHHMLLGVGYASHTELRTGSKPSCPPELRNIACPKYRQSFS